MFLPPSDIRSKAVLLNCFHLRNFTSSVNYTLKINMEHVLMEVWFRSFSFLDGWFVGSMVVFQGVMVDRWFGAPVVWDSNRDTPKVRVPFIFGDRRNPNYRAPKPPAYHYLIQVTGRKMTFPETTPSWSPSKFWCLEDELFPFREGMCWLYVEKEKKTKRETWGYDMSNVR